MAMTVDETLRALSFTASLPEPVIRGLAEVCAMRVAPAGTTLFREGETHDEFSIIADGHVSLRMNVPARGDLPILSLSTGDILAWSALLAHGRMTSSAQAVSDVQLLTFQGPELRRLCEADHEVGFHLMSRVASALSRRLLATRLQLLDLFASQPPPVDPAKRA
ncbi:MAG: cyclic nucleotide-binding domain-containing protein [Planctomyces sp.]|nr:cyclic nucleotide-binding domain-containing protein [Planctomyces sp.]